MLEVTSGGFVHLRSMELSDTIAGLDRKIAQMEQARRLHGATPAETLKKRGRLRRRPPRLARNRPA